MKKLLELITKEFESAFERCGYDAKLGKVGISNRPDLCQYQCNGAMAGAKLYHKAPIMIANDVVEAVGENSMFSYVEAVKPGFININLNGGFLAEYLNQMKSSEKLGTENDKPETIVVDYGGANVAKPLHVGHLRPAIIGESVKRIKKYMGNQVIGDVHLGDWGLQIGLIIMELKERKPELVYFDENYTGDYPSEPPFTIDEFAEIYPAANVKAKNDETFKAKAQEATVKFQNGYPPYKAIWKHIMTVSGEDLKKNYGNLNVHFELWKGESDAKPYIPELFEILENKGLVHESQGALVVDIAKEEDKKELPPCIVRKADGADLYATSDLGTILQRQKDYAPDEIIYLADKRQELHFTQVFRVARRAGLVNPQTRLIHIGFGTVNGEDGKPFKTRDGGVMQLDALVSEINGAVYDKMMENRTMELEEVEKVSKIIGLAALKYGDLSNQAAKDYIFDIDKFTSFEGNTGPYILYTIVRIKSIIDKYKEQGNSTENLLITDTENEEQLQLMIEIAKANEVIENAAKELAPHKICSYIYDLSNAFNRFYHGTKILVEEDEVKKKGYIALIDMTKTVLETGIHLLGFEAPDRM